MKLILFLLLMLTTNAFAFEQLYAINAGGNAHVDSDGITYKADREKSGSDRDFAIGNVPQSDRPIYQTYTSFFSSPEQVKIINHNLPVKSDGLYVLIVKFSALPNNKDAVVNLKLNNIIIISNVRQASQCGGEMKSCDAYFYFGVADRQLYIDEQTSAVVNGRVKLEFSGASGRPVYNGVVLLKGTVGERLKLNASSSTETVHFDPVKFNSKCFTTSVLMSSILSLQEQQRDNTKNLQACKCTDTTSASLNVSEAIEGVRKSNAENHQKLSEEFESLQKKLRKIEKLSKENALAQSERESAQTANAATHSKINADIESLRGELKQSLQQLPDVNAVVQAAVEGIQKANTEAYSSLLNKFNSQQEKQKKDLQRLEDMERNINETIVANNEILLDQCSDQIDLKVEEMESALAKNRPPGNAGSEKTILKVQTTLAEMQLALSELEKRYEEILSSQSMDSDTFFFVDPTQIRS